MNLDVTVSNKQVVVRLQGKITVNEAADMRSMLLQLVEEGNNQFILHMDQVDFIDSAGLGVLVTLLKRARARGGEVIIKGLKGTVKEVFELTRLTKVFNIQE